MATKLKIVKITYKELESIVDKKAENSNLNQQNNFSKDKRKKSRRPEIGIYRPPSLLKHKQNDVSNSAVSHDDVNNRAVNHDNVNNSAVSQDDINNRAVNHDNVKKSGVSQDENWEDEFEDRSTDTNSKENSAEREELHISERNDGGKTRRKRPEIQRYVPKGKILELQQNKNEDDRDLEKNPLFIDEDVLMSDKQDQSLHIQNEDVKNIKITVSKDGGLKQISREIIHDSDCNPPVSKTRSEIHHGRNNLSKQNSEEPKVESGSFKTINFNDRVSLSPKPQRIERRRGKFPSGKYDPQTLTDEDGSDNDFIQTMVFERRDNHGSKLTMENLSQKPPRGNGRLGGKRYSANMRRPRAGSFSSDVSTGSDLSIDQETTERILDWDKEVEIEMAKQVHDETQKLKEYLEKQEDGMEWGKDIQSSSWGDWASQVASPDDIQDTPPSWENIKPAGSHDMLDRLKEEDKGNKGYQNAGTFPRRNKRNSGDNRFRENDSRNTNWNAGSWDRRWTKDKNPCEMDDYYRGYGRRERRSSEGSKGQRRRRQSRESGGRRSRDSSVSSVHSVRSNHGDEDMYGSYRRPRRQNSSSSLRGVASRERLNDPEGLNLKVTIASDKRQVVVPETEGNKTQGRGRGRGRGRRQHGLDTSHVGSRGNSEEPEQGKEEKNKENSDTHNRNVGRGRGGQRKGRDEDWNRGDYNRSKEVEGHRQGYNRQNSGGHQHDKETEGHSHGYNRQNSRGHHHGKESEGHSHGYNRQTSGGQHHGKELEGHSHGYNRQNSGGQHHGKESEGHSHGYNRQNSGGQHHGYNRQDSRGQHPGKEIDGQHHGYNRQDSKGHHHGNKKQDGGRNDWKKDKHPGKKEERDEKDDKDKRDSDRGQMKFSDKGGSRSRNNSEQEKEEWSPRNDKGKTFSGGLIKLPLNVHTTEEQQNDKSSHTEKAVSPKPKESVTSTRQTTGQRQLFDPKNPTKPIYVKESQNLNFYDPPGMESPSPPAQPQTPPFPGYGQFYGPQFPQEQGMYPGPPIPPQMMAAHRYFYGFPPPQQYLEMVRGKQRDLIFEKMLNDCLALDNELGRLVARRLNGDSLSQLDSKRQELMKRYEHLILMDIDLSSKHNVDQLLWKAVFYQVIEVFRRHMNEEDDSKSKLSQILDEGTAFYESLLQKLQQTFRYKLEDFLDTNTLPPDNIHRYVKLSLLGSQRIMICLGDIARYREQMNDKGKVNYGRARNWYTKAQTLAPKNGRPYNQLAILALYTRRKLDAVYYYMRSLAASNPFLTARESLMSLFDEARKKSEAAEKKRCDEKDKEKCVKPHQHKHGERIEIWIAADGTSSEDRGGNDPNDDLEKLDAVELNKRFVLSFLNIHGKLFTKIGRESFPECCAMMLKEFRALLKYNAIGPTRLLQLMAINMFAVENTALKDTALPSGFRSELQEQAVELGLYMFGVLVERCSEQLKDHLKSPDYPTKLFNAEIEELMPGVKIWTDWMICNSQYWNPPPSTLDPSLGVNIDVWSTTSGLCNILKDIDISHVKFYSERKEGCEPVLLMEDTMLSGFVPLLSAPIETSFVHNLVDKEIAQDCLRIQKLQLFGDYLCGIEPPMLAYNVEKKEYYSIALSVEETEEQNKPSLSADEWSDDEDVIIESEEEIIQEGDDDHVKDLKVKKHKLKKMKLEQEKQKENVQKIIDKNRHHCIELEIRPIFLVPDTNCFIEHLTGLKKLILSQKFTVTVPLVVVNELDGLAKGSRDGQYSTPQHANKVRKTAEESVQFLEAEFEKKNSHLKTQTSKGNTLETLAFRSEESEKGTGNNDDIILSCCLHYCKDKAREFMPKEKDGPVRLYRDVVLLTDDRNLRLKAHTHNVPVKDVLSFLHWSKIT